MPTFGFIMPPVPGHVLPSIAQAKELQRRGHTVRFYQVCDLRKQIEDAGIEFCSLGEKRLPPGTLTRMRREVASLRGIHAAIRSVQQFLCTGKVFAADLADALEQHPVDALLIDQVEPVPGLVARALKVPYASVANALPIDPDPAVPPPMTAWLPGGPICELRNRLSYQLMRLVFAPTFRLLRQAEKRFGLPRERALMPYLSRQARIAQLVEPFDFPRKNRSTVLHYVGSTRGTSSCEIDFDWDWLDGRPLIYASLGTTVCRQHRVLRRIAESATRQDIQMVLSLGGQGDQRALGPVPENVRLVHYAPQPELIAKSAMVITHAGMNTTMETIRFGKPALAMPISYEQPGIAARIQYTGMGLRLPLHSSPHTIQSATERILAKPRFAEASEALMAASQSAGGSPRVAEIAEGLLS